MSNATQFRAVVKGKNFITPEIMRYGQQGDYVYELSKGAWLDAGLYGVTVVDLRTNKHRNDLSRSFTDYKQANEYINDLEKQA